jgi:hypothetical protein
LARIEKQVNSYRNVDPNKYASLAEWRAAFPDDDPEWRDWAWELVSAQKASSSFTGAEERKETEPDQPRQEVGAKRTRLASDDAPTGEPDVELLLEDDARSKRKR